MKFREKIYSKLGKVPKGRVTTYKTLAHSLNSKVYRAVGTAMNKNPYGYPISSEAVRNRRSAIRGDSKRNSGFFLVPCHRVINVDGRVGGFASGTKKKIEMLKKEGVRVVKGRVDLDKYFYELK
ncbi:MAG: MGMT family protein [Nanoarchaeota archaeon]|nr:MGMT family protein [Nanoarchaeota archaeon]